MITSSKSALAQQAIKEIFPEEQVKASPSCKEVVTFKLFFSQLMTIAP